MRRPAWAVPVGSGTSCSVTTWRPDERLGQPLEGRRAGRRVGTEQPVGEVQVGDVGVAGRRRRRPPDGSVERTTATSVAAATASAWRTTPWSSGPTTMLHTVGRPAGHRTGSVVRSSSADGSKRTSPRSASSVSQPRHRPAAPPVVEPPGVGDDLTRAGGVEAGRRVPLVVGGRRRRTRPAGCRGRGPGTPGRCPRRRSRGTPRRTRRAVPRGRSTPKLSDQNSSWSSPSRTSSPSGTGRAGGAALQAVERRRRGSSSQPWRR